MRKRLQICLVAFFLILAPISSGMGAEIPVQAGPTLQTDQADYTQGSPFVLQGQGFPLGSAISLSIRNPNGAFIWFEQTNTLTGAFSVSSTIPSGWQSGAYLAKAVQGNPVVASTCSFQVMSGLALNDEAVQEIPSTQDLQTETASALLNLVSGWNLVSLPIITPTNPFDVFSGLPSPWKLYAWDAFTGRYIDRNQICLHVGEGYWLWAPISLSYAVTGQPNNNSQTTVALSRGWNLFGIPNQRPYSWADVRLDLDGLSLSLAEASDPNGSHYWVKRPAYQYASGSYQSVGVDSSLEPTRGYWLRTLVDGLSLVFPVSNGMSLDISPTTDVATWNSLAISATVSRLANWVVQIYQGDTLIDSLTASPTIHLSLSWVPPISYQFSGRHKVVVAADEGAGVVEHSSSEFSIYNFPLKITSLEFLNQMGQPITEAVRNQPFMVKMTVRNWWTGGGAVPAPFSFVPVKMTLGPSLYLGFVLFFDIQPGTSVAATAAFSLPESGVWETKAAVWQGVDLPPFGDPTSAPFPIKP